MNKEQEKEYQRHLTSLDKDTLISLYLQKCYDTDIEIADLEAKLAEKEKEIALLEEQDGIYHNQLAIVELERAKIEFETYYADNIWNYPQYLEDRIAELTHQHENKGE